jgi:chromosome segregation ATPase
MDQHPVDTEKRVVFRAIAEQLIKFGPRAARLSTLRKRTQSASPLPETPIAKRTRRASEEHHSGSSTAKLALPLQRARSRAKSSTQGRSHVKSSKNGSARTAPSTDEFNDSDASHEHRPTLATIRALEREIDQKIELIRKLEAKLLAVASDGAQDDLKSQIAGLETELDVLNTDLEEAVHFAALHEASDAQPQERPMSGLPASQKFMAGGSYQDDFAEVAPETQSAQENSKTDACVTNFDGHSAVIYEASELHAEAATQAEARDDRVNTDKARSKSETLQQTATLTGPQETRATEHENAEAASEDDLVARASAAVLRRELHAVKSTSELFRVENETLRASHAVLAAENRDLQLVIARAAAASAADAEEQRATYAEYDFELLKRSEALVKSEQDFAVLKESDQQLQLRVERLMFEQRHLQDSTSASIMQHQQAVQTLEEALERAEMERADLQDSVHAAENNTGLQQERIEELIDEMDRVRAALAEKNDSLSAAQTRLEELAQVEATAKELESTLASERKSMEGLQSQLKQMAASSEKRITNLTTSCQEEKRRACAAEEALSATKRDFEETLSSIQATHSEEVTRCSIRRDELEQNNVVLSSEIDQLQSNTTTLKIALQAAEAHAKEMMERNERLVEAQTDLTKQLAQRSTTVDRLLATIADLEASSQRFMQEHNALIAKALESGYSSASSASRAARQRGDDSGIGFDEYLDLA